MLEILPLHHFDVNLITSSVEAAGSVLESRSRNAGPHSRRAIRTIRPPGELLLDRVTRAERQGDEWPDEPCAGGESIEPRLAGDDVNLSRRDLHRARIPRREADPKRFALILGHHDPAELEPGAGRRVPSRETRRSGTPTLKPPDPADTVRSVTSGRDGAWWALFRPLAERRGGGV